MIFARCLQDIEYNVNCTLNFRDLERVGPCILLVAWCGSGSLFKV
jgi:hypothetical protein